MILPNFKEALENAHFLIEIEDLFVAFPNGPDRIWRRIPLYSSALHLRFLSSFLSFRVTPSRNIGGNEREEYLREEEEKNWRRPT